MQHCGISFDFIGLFESFVASTLTKIAPRSAFGYIVPTAKRAVRCGVTNSLQQLRGD